MTDKPIKVLFVYRENDPWIHANHYNSTYYNFYAKALKRNKDIDVTYQPDSIRNHESHDVLLLFGTVPDVKDVKIPIFAEMGDPHSRVKLELDQYVTCFYSSCTTEYVHQFFPKDSYNYKVLIYGVEPNLFENIIPFKNRINDKICNSGAADYPSLKNNIKHIAKKILGKSKKKLLTRHYKLRSACNYLKYVDYTPASGHKYNGDRYTELLQKYCASIAASTEFPTRKYLEIPASGCLTFMEITKFNRGDHLGFTDGVNAIYINEDNYKDKFEEYLSDIDNPKWEEIANKGREYVMNNLTNDTAVKKLVEIMRETMQ